jgi:hypothetical protein
VSHYGHQFGTGSAFEMETVRIRKRLQTMQSLAGSIESAPHCTRAVYSICTFFNRTNLSLQFHQVTVLPFVRGSSKRSGQGRAPYRASSCSKMAAGAFCSGVLCQDGQESSSVHKAASWTLCTLLGRYNAADHS